MSVEPEVVLVARGLRWSFGGPFTVQVERLDVTAGRGLAVLGRSGSGKSSLLRLLGRVEAGYFPPAPAFAPRGELRLQTRGLSVDMLRAGEAALGKIRGRHLGFVAQREGLFADLSPRENIAWPLRALGMPAAEADRRADRWLEAVELPRAARTPLLSGGERKRLALARALAPEPAALLLDEPLTGLDAASAGALRRLLRAQKEVGTALVLVTHQREDVDALADDLAIVRGGEVVATGPREALRAEEETVWRAEQA